MKGLLLRSALVLMGVFSFSSSYAIEIDCGSYKVQPANNGLSVMVCPPQGCITHAELDELGVEMRPATGDVFAGAGVGTCDQTSDDGSWCKVGLDGETGLPLVVAAVTTVKGEAGGPFINPGPPWFECDMFSPVDPRQPKAVHRVEMPYPDVTGSYSFPDIVRDIGGAGESDLTYKDSGSQKTMRVFMAVYAPDYVPEGGGSTRKNSCSAPGFREDMGEWKFEWCGGVTSGISQTGNYGVWSKRLPYGCDHMPGYQEVDGECVLFAEHSVKKPSGAVPCETVLDGNGKFTVDPMNPDCAAAPVEVLDGGNAVKMHNSIGENMRIGVENGNQLSLEYWNNDRWMRAEIGPYDESLKGRPVLSVSRGSGSVVGLNPDPGSGGGGDSGGGDSGGGDSGGGDSGGGGPGSGDGNGDGDGDGDGGDGTFDMDLSEFEKTAEEIIEPLIQAVDHIRNFVPSIPAGSCPTPSAEFYGKSYAVTQHCDFLEDNRSLVSNVMLLVFSIISLLVVLRS